LSTAILNGLSMPGTCFGGLIPYRLEGEHGKTEDHRPPEPELFGNKEGEETERDAAGAIVESRTGGECETEGLVPEAHGI
jgi:hypothetical protein